MFLKTIVTVFHLQSALDKESIRHSVISNGNDNTSIRNCVLNKYCAILLSNFGKPVITKWAAFSTHSCWQTNCELITSQYRNHAVYFRRRRYWHQRRLWLTYALIKRYGRCDQPIRANDWNVRVGGFQCCGFGTDCNVTALITATDTLINYQCGFTSQSR